MHLDQFIITFGYIGIFIAIFAESGFFLGFFLPGDSLLVTLGILASQGHFSIGILIGICIAAAILGDSLGYFMGSFFGHALFSKVHKKILKPEYLERTEAFFQKYGKKTIILSRVVPIVRTFAPIFAGIGTMSYGTFLTYNIIGGTVWAGGLLSISYYLGRKIPNIDKYLGYIIVVIIIASLIPPVLEFWKHYKKTKK